MTKSSREEVIKQLHKVYLFDSLNEEQLGVVYDAMRDVSLRARETLFEFDRPADRFFLLRSGQVKLFRISADGDEKVMEVIHPGQTFAEAIMFMEKHNYPVNAEAIEPSELFSFDMKAFTELLKDSTDTCFRLMASMSRRLHSRIEEINNLTLQNATYRLVVYLLEHMPEDAGDATIHLETPKSVIASRLSIQPETFSRILSKLSKVGLISVHGNNIALQDLKGLQKLL
jgi:CRP-like cAMP-binding protein